jgi:hypothetical protein
MALSFKSAQIDFTLSVLSFSDLDNSESIAKARNLGRELNVDVKVVTVDAIKFFEEGHYLAYGQKYNCKTAESTLLLWYLDQLDGTPVLSGDPIVPVYLNQKLVYMNLADDAKGSFLNYFFTNDRAGVPFFFHHTPELISSLLQAPVLQPFRSGLRTKFEDYSEDIKLQNFQETGFLLNNKLKGPSFFQPVFKHYDLLFNTEEGSAVSTLFDRPLTKLNPFTQLLLQRIPQNYYSNEQTGFFKFF